jgi:pSer/pThr/pTyr-binding forkhead associated (FHA) protein
MGGAGAVNCPACGAAAIPGEAFCDNCGAALLPSYSYAPMQTPAPVQSPAQAPQASAQYGGYAQAVAQRAASLVVTNPPPPATLSIPNLPELIVGRSDPQSNSYPDVDLGPYGGLDLGVSRRHFRLSRNGDQFYLEDLGSVNGTVVNGQRVTSHNLHPLRSGDHIALGKMEMTFELA